MFLVLILLSMIHCYINMQTKKMVAHTELSKNLQVELSGFGRYLVATLIPSV